MEKSLSQSFLLSKRLIIKQKIRKQSFSFEQKQFLKKVAFKEKKQIIFLVVFKLLQVICELALVAFARLYARKSFNALNFQELHKSILIAFLSGIAYLACSYFVFKYAFQIQIRLINLFRENIVKKFILGKFGANERERGSLISKVTYQLSLIQMGFSKILTNSLHLVFSIIFIAFLIPLIDLKLFVFLFFFIAVYIFAMFVSYLIASRFISKEQTISSAIIEHIHGGIEKIDFIKKTYNEKQFLKTLNELVSLDSFFRQRRNIWINQLYKIVFVFASITMIILYRFIPRGSDWKILSISNSFEFIVILGLLIRLIYLASGIGFYFYPVKIGFIIAAENFSMPEVKKISVKLQEIKFKARKVKLNSKKNYFKNVLLSFKKGEKVAIVSNDKDSLHCLEKIFSFDQDVFSAPWIVFFNGKRYSYESFLRKFHSAFLVNGCVVPNLSFAEVFTGKLSNEISSNDLRELLKILKKFSFFKRFFNLNKKTATIVNSNIPFSDKILLQIGYLLYKKPEIVIFSNDVINLNSKEVQEAIKFVSKELKNSIQIIFSEKKQKLLQVDKLIQIKNEKIFEKKS